MTISEGDTFYMKHPGCNSLYHLFVVIRHLGDNVLMVNFTTFMMGKDNSCILNNGEHPFIVCPTCVNYKDIINPKIEEIKSLFEMSSITIEKREPVSEAVLAKIKMGALNSPFLPTKYRQYFTAP